MILVRRFLGKPLPDTPITGRSPSADTLVLSSVDIEAACPAGSRLDDRYYRDSPIGTCGCLFSGGQPSRILQWVGSTGGLSDALSRVLDAVEAASPVEAVEAVTRELGAALRATTVSFLIADLSGRALVRLAHATTSEPT